MSGRAVMAVRAVMASFPADTALRPAAFEPVGRAASAKAIRGSSTSAWFHVQEQALTRARATGGKDQAASATGPKPVPGLALRTPHSPLWS